MLENIPVKLLVHKVIIRFIIDDKQSLEDRVEVLKDYEAVICGFDCSHCNYKTDEEYINTFINSIAVYFLS